MSFSQDNGYVPVTLSEVMEFIRIEINVQFGTTFTTDSFIGSNWYKYFYTIAQRVLQNETKTSEIFLKLRQYIKLTNEKIQRPSVSLPGLIESFESKGYEVSVAPMNEFTAGYMYIAVNVDSTAPDYAATKQEIGELMKDFIVGGIVTMGNESVTVFLSNGQSFDFKYSLPSEIEIKMRLTILKSDNYPGIILSDEALRNLLFANFKARYRMGWDLEPQRYMTQTDLPWAADIKVEWSNNGGTTYSTEVAQLSYVTLVTLDLNDILVVINES